MPENNKHNLYTKEELFSMLDGKKQIPGDMDDFDKEALEGLSMVTDRSGLDSINESVDEAIRREAAKSNKKRALYFVSAAASLALIIGLFFLFKENNETKTDKPLAEYKEPAKLEIPAKQSPPAEEKSIVSVQNAAGSGDMSGKGKESPRMKVDEVTVNSKITPSDQQAAPIEQRLETENQLSKSAQGAGAADYRFVEGKDDKLNDALKAQQEEKKTTDESKLAKHITTVDKDRLLREDDKKRDLTTPATVSAGEKNIAATETSSNTTANNETNIADNNDGNGNIVEELDNTNSNAGKANLSNKSGNKKERKSKEKEKSSGVARSQTVITKQSEQPGQSVAGNKSPQKAAGLTSDYENTQAGPGDFKKEEGKKEKAQADSVVSSSPAGYGYYAQTSSKSITSPEYIGGDAALQKFVVKNLVISSPGYSGTIQATFLVLNNGGIDTSSVKITQGIKNCPACSADVTDLIKKMPKWKPANENKKNIPYTQKISIRYNEKAVKK